MKVCAFHVEVEPFRPRNIRFRASFTIMLLMPVRTIRLRFPFLLFPLTGKLREEGPWCIIPVLLPTPLTKRTSVRTLRFHKTQVIFRPD